MKNKRKGDKMFKVPLVEISKKFNIPYRTLQSFKSYKDKDDYRIKVVDIMSDMIALENIAKDNLFKFADKEIGYIKNAIDNYLKNVKIDKKNNDYLLMLIKDNEKLKELVEKEMLDNHLDPRPVLYKIDKYLDKLDRYFLVKERL